MKQPLRIIFAGTPVFAAEHLQALLDSSHEVVAVYTQPDRPAGRGKKLTPSEVKRVADAAGVTIEQPASLRSDEARQQLAAYDADVLVVVAYGLILPQAILDTPQLGCINVHGSLLPRWRGAAPIQRAVEAGDNASGICIMQMEAGLDTGPVLAEARCTISNTDTSANLHDRLQQIGPPLLLEVLDDLIGRLQLATPQDDNLATYADKITKAEAALDWHRCATALDRAIRAFTPFPVAYTMLGEERLKIWRAKPISDAGGASPGTLVHAGPEGLLVACGEGALLLQTVQLPGGKALEVGQLLNARAELFAVGTVLGST